MVPLRRRVAVSVIGTSPAARRDPEWRDTHPDRASSNARPVRPARIVSFTQFGRGRGHADLPRLEGGCTSSRRRPADQAQGQNPEPGPPVSFRVMPERGGNRRWKPDAEGLLVAVAGIAAAAAHTAFP